MLFFFEWKKWKVKEWFKGIGLRCIFLKKILRKKKELITFLTTFYISLFKKWSINKCSFCLAWVKEKKNLHFPLFNSHSLLQCVSLFIFSDFPLFVFLLLSFLGFHTMAEWTKCFLSSIFFFSAFYMFRASTQKIARKLLCLAC